MGDMQYKRALTAKFEFSTPNLGKFKSVRGLVMVRYRFALRGPIQWGVLTCSMTLKLMHWCDRGALLILMKPTMRPAVTL